MQDRKGSDPGYLVPGTWYLAPVPNSHISNFNKALLLYCRFDMKPLGSSAIAPRFYPASCIPHVRFFEA